MIEIPLAPVPDFGPRTVASGTEEAISAVVFGHAKEHSFFESLSSVDYGLLRTVQTMTHPFEVRDKSLREWEQAILSGYSVWRKMRENRGGVFVGSSALRSVSYESL